MMPRASELARDWAWLRQKALLHAAAVQRWAVHPATILACLHLLLMLWVWGRWHAAVQQYGMAVGPGADFASGLVSWVDFPVSRACEAIAYGGAHSTSPVPYWFLSLIGVRSLSDLTLGLYWPLLFALGTAQWLLIGLAVAHLRARWRPRRPRAMPIERRPL